MPLRDFHVLKFLGKGSYGAVHKVQRKSDGKYYAMKEVKIRYMSQVERQDAVNEIRLLAMVKHPMIIRYCESFYENDKLYIVTDFAANGDLHDQIKGIRAQGRRYEEDTVWNYFIQLCIGMEHLHRKKILHRDLKCQNIFVSEGKQLKIGDLGVGKVLKAGMTYTQVGTPYYISPEIWRKQPYNQKSDVWSLGCVLYELLTFRHPFVADSPKALASKIMAGRYTPISSSFSRDMSRVVNLLLQTDQRRRPSVEQVLAMKEVQERMHLIPDAVRVVARNPRNAGTQKVVRTIKVPRNLAMVNQNLPSPAYPGKTMVRRGPLFSSPDGKGAALSDGELSDGEQAPGVAAKNNRNQGGADAARDRAGRPAAVQQREVRPAIRVQGGRPSAAAAAAAGGGGGGVGAGARRESAADMAARARERMDARRAGAGRNGNGAPEPSREPARAAVGAGYNANRRAAAGARPEPQHRENHRGGIGAFPGQGYRREAASRPTANQPSRAAIGAGGHQRQAVGGLQVRGAARLASGADHPQPRREALARHVPRSAAVPSGAGNNNNNNGRNDNNIHRGQGAGAQRSDAVPAARNENGGVNIGAEIQRIKERRRALQDIVNRRNSMNNNPSNAIGSKPQHPAGGAAGYKAREAARPSVGGQENRRVSNLVQGRVVNDRRPAGRNEPSVAKQVNARLGINNGARAAERAPASRAVANRGYRRPSYHDDPGARRAAAAAAVRPPWA